MAALSFLSEEWLDDLADGAAPAFIQVRRFWAAAKVEVDPVGEEEYKWTINLSSIFQRISLVTG